MPSSSLSRYLRIFLGLILVLALNLLLLKFENVVGVGLLAGIESSERIANETLGFEKIFVVNTPWRTDRKDAMILAAGYSELQFQWVDGLQGEMIHEKAYPPGNHRNLSPGSLGSWRAHMDAMREIVAQNLTTALVLEDDVDWDVRIRTQLLPLTHATRKLSLLAQEVTNQQTPPAFETKSQIELAKRSTLPITSADTHNTPIGPYGRDWDVLWLGHCGTDLPPPSPAAPDRVMLLNDFTVPSPKHLRLHESSPPDPIATLYPPYTRVYHRKSNSTLCTLAYAVTQRGARKILFELGIRDLSKGFDFALSDYCAGLVKGDGNGLVRNLECLTAQPPLFSHYWDERSRSDITGLGIGGRPEVGSRYIIRSMRANLEGLVEGSETLYEQWSE